MLTDYLSSPVFITAAVSLVIAVYVFTYSAIAAGAVMALILSAMYIAALLELPQVNSGILAGPIPFDNIFGTRASTVSPSDKHEVYYVAGNNYTYDDAPFVCAAQNAELATHDQVNEAYGKGAEWCGYGWTMGGMALFPTQEASWTKLQNEIDIKKKTKCGRPGVNGGYFDPATKFGVNCYGVKPACTDCKTGSTDPAVALAANKFKQAASDMKFSPFNRSEWSMWGV